MSDKIDLNMYGTDDLDVQQQPVLLSKNRVSLTNLGKTQSMEVDGQTVFIVDPQWVDNLEKRLNQTAQTCIDLHNKLLRANSTIAKLTQRVDTLGRQLERITGDS
jgi:hypothetical protein